MPFDSPREDSVLANLIAARALIEDPAHHLMGAFKHVADDGTVRRCSAQALADAMDENGALGSVMGAHEWRLLRDSSRSEMLGVCGTNNLGHGYAMAMYDRAIEARREELRHAVR